MRVLAICGSLRNGAYSLLALQALSALASPPFDVGIRRLSDVPMFSPDDYEAHHYPASAASFREDVVAADGIVIATPEYNQSIPGALKNALEWLHGRPGLLEGKPVAMLSTSPGPNGGMHAQYALRSILKSMGARVLELPDLAISDVRNKFDKQGAPTDDATRTSLKAFLQALETALGITRQVV